MAAALKHPDIYAEYTPGSGGPGGGPYMTTMSETILLGSLRTLCNNRKDEYKNYLMNSPHYLEMPAKMGENGGANGEDNGLWGCFTWELLKDWELLLLH